MPQRKQQENKSLWNIENVHVFIADFIDQNYFFFVFLLYLNVHSIIDFQVKEKVGKGLKGNVNNKMNKTVLFVFLTVVV